MPAARRRAEQAAAEARALFVGPVDEREVTGGVARAASARSTSSPPATPSAPSSQPPFGHRVEVAAEPTMPSALARGASAQSCPASSRRRVSGSSSRRSRNHVARLAPDRSPRDPLGAALVRR